MVTNASPRQRCVVRAGVTLVELMIVLVILVGLASVMVPMFANSREDSAERTTRASLVAVRDALTQQHLDTKYIALTGPPETVAIDATRFHLRWLFHNPVTGDASNDFDPDTRTGWNGPYLMNNTGQYAIDATKNLTASYGSDGDPAILDTYTGTPIVCQVVGSGPLDVRLVSAGTDGVVDIDPTDATADLASEGGTEPTGDDIYVAFTLR
ncbi:MAG: prepilin-type N-terminal cleavage/methylation domain-containing protein [Pirellulales bacterium]|nr:prepilin-type N-terminal cleavage/methylation domain-containing protein [Pirellulales bacterium]